jgi:hypothetical protein
MLAAHPRVAIPPETAFLRRYVLRGSLERIGRRHGKRALVEHLEADDRFLRLGMSAQRVVRAAAEKGVLDGPTIYRAMLDEYALKHGKNIVGDKDPRLIEHLEPLSRIFPNARIVHVFRDPRDVLLSKKRAAWSRNRPVLRHVFANRVQFKLGRRTGPRFFGDRYVELQYERLLGDPRSVLSDLCGRLGLSFEPAMLDFGDAARELVSPEEVAWKSETLGPLLTDNSGKWREGLDPGELCLSERACAQAMRAGDYGRSTARRDLRFGARLAVGLELLTIAAADPVYRVIRGARNRFVSV